MRLAALILILVLTLEGTGQDLIRLQVVFRDVSEKSLEPLLEPRFYPDSLILRQGVDSVISQVQQRGFLEARLFKFQADSAGFLATLEAGPLYNWKLKNLNINDEAIRAGNLSRYFEGSTLPFSLYQVLQKNIIAWYENHGYPFASLQAEDISLEGHTFEARLKVDPSFFIVYDTLRLSGGVTLTPGFLSAHTGIRPGQPYSEKRTREAAELMAELNFIQLSGEPFLHFTPGSARLIIPVRKRPSNRFDGIAGISSNTLDKNRLQLTGQLNLLLVNLLSRGEEFAMAWQGLGQGTQRLTLDASYPYLFSMPFISSWQFSLQKQDTSYLNLRNRPSFTWNSPGRIQFSIFADLQSTELLSTSRFSGYASLPPQIDSRTQLYGLEGALFSRGFNAGLMDGQGLKVSVSAGTRSIRKNASLPETIYEGIALKQNQFSFALEAESRIPLARRTRLVLQINARGLSGQQFFENELFRIGGVRTLKGFEEEAFLASFYGIMSGEIRYFTGEDSFISLLLNAAYFERKLLDDLVSGWPWGAAAGITLETAPGIISIFYALGRGPETPMAFRNAKVHIGFVSLF